MPFTFAHPAIILPFGRLPNKWFSWTGLIVGALVPDFEYFIRFRVLSVYSHTIGGLFWFDLPLAIVIAFVFHAAVRSVLFNNLPDPLWRRLSLFDQFNWPRYFSRNWHVVVISILIGAASHLFWDAFTHSAGYFVQACPALSNEVPVFGFGVPVFKVLQHTSSVLGGSAVLITLIMLPIHDQPEKKMNRRYWPIVITLAAVITLLTAALGHVPIGNVIVSAISGTLIGLIVAGTLIGRRAGNRTDGGAAGTHST